MDLYSRKIIGWSMSSWIKQDLVRQALMNALEERGVTPDLLFHSDRGAQYASNAFQKDLKSNGLIGSMSRKGNCWDNAVVESFFKTLKQEYLNLRRFKTRLEARRSTFEFIECFYNSKRLHSTLGYLSPNEFEAAYFV